MRKNFYLAAACGVMAAGLLTVNFCLAQTELSLAPETPEVSSAAADFDNSLGTEILGVGDPGMLPTSPFYFFKDWGRSLGTALTFSAEGKAEKKLRHASERLAEAREMLRATDKDDDEQNAKIKETLRKHREEMEYAREKTESIKDKSDIYNSLLEKSAAKYAAFAKVMAPDEDLALDIGKDIVAEIYKSKEEALENLGGLISRLDDPAAKLEAVLQGQPGSEFKEFRNLEVLGELADRVPEQAVGAILAAQERIRARMEVKLVNAVAGKTGEEFADYVMALKGNQAGHMAILDDLAKSPDIPDEVARGFRRAKDAAAVNFSIKMINHPASKEMMEAIASGDIDKLRVLEELADALPEDSAVRGELAAARQKAIDRAVEKISTLETLDDKINFLIKDGVPDAKSFVLLDEIQAKFSPEQQEEVKAIRDKAFEVFSEVIDNSENQDKLLERLAGDSPKDTAVIAVIRQYLPAASAPAFDKLIVKQLAKVEARIAGEGDLEKLVSLRAELDGSPEAQEMMNKMAPEMLERLNEAQVMKAEEIFSAAEDPVKMLGVFNMYNGILEKHPEVEAKLRERNPELVDRMIANRAEQINKYLEKLGDPGEIDMALADMEAAGLGEFRARAPQSVNARMDEDIAGRYRQLHRKRFLEQARQQAGDRFDAAEFESAFDRDLAPMFKAGEKPDQAAIDAVRAQIEERIRGEAEAGAEREKAMMEAGAPAGDMTSAPSPEDIERIRQEAMQGQIGQTAPTAPEGGSFASPTAPPPSADTTAPSPEEIERMRQEQMPSAEEIERMRQEAMRQQMEQMMPPQ